MTIFYRSVGASSTLLNARDFGLHPLNSGEANYSALSKALEKGSVFIPIGEYIIKPTQLVSNKNIVGESWDTILKLDPDTVDNDKIGDRASVLSSLVGTTFESYTTENVAIRNITIDGNGDNLDINNFEGNVQAPGHCVEVSSSKNITLDTCLLRNAWFDGVYAGGSLAKTSENVWIRNCSIKNVGRNFQSFTSIMNSGVTDCFCDGSGQGVLRTIPGYDPLTETAFVASGLNLEANANSLISGVLMQGNTVLKSFSGFILLMEGLTGLAERVNILNNFFGFQDPAIETVLGVKSAQYAFIVRGDSNNKAKDNIIEGNTICCGTGDNGQTTQARTRVGLRLEHCENTHIRNNTFIGGIDPTEGNGSLTEAVNSPDCSIHNNTYKRNTGTNRFDIQVFSGCGGLRVHENKVTDTVRVEANSGAILGVNYRSDAFATQTSGELRQRVTDAGNQAGTYTADFVMGAPYNQRVTATGALQINVYASEETGLSIEHALYKIYVYNPDNHSITIAALSGTSPPTVLNNAGGATTDTYIEYNISYEGSRIFTRIK